MARAYLAGLSRRAPRGAGRGREAGRLRGEELIGPDTVNTAPPATIDLFRDHGVVRATLAEGVEEARATLEALGRSGVSLDEVTDHLLEEGLRLFVVPFDKLLAAVDRALAKHPG